MLSVSPIKKTKKNETRHFRHLVRVDRTAFGKLDDQVAVLSLFWKSTETKFILAHWTTPSSQTIVGYAAYQIKDSECYLLRIAVDSQWQGKGIGRALFSRLCELCTVLRLEVSDDNSKAYSFYERMGMECTDHREASTPGVCGFFDFELHL